MVREAESHAAEDARRREEVDVRNQIDSLVYTVERGVREQRAKLQAPEISRIEQALEQARTASNLERMRAVQPQLEEVARLVGEAESRPSGGDQTASGPGPSSHVGDAEVIDEPH